MSRGARRLGAAVADQPGDVHRADRRLRDLDLPDLLDVRRGHPVQRRDQRRTAAAAARAPSWPRTSAGVFANDHAAFALRPGELAGGVERGDAVGGVLLDAGRVRVRQAAVPRPQRDAAGDRRHDDGADPARADPALHADGEDRLERQSAGGHRAVPGQRFRRLHDAPVRRRGDLGRAGGGRPGGRLLDLPDLLERRAAGTAAGRCGPRSADVHADLERVHLAVRRSRTRTLPPSSCRSACWRRRTTPTTRRSSRRRPWPRCPCSRCSSSSAARSSAESWKVRSSRDNRQPDRARHRTAVPHRFPLRRGHRRLPGGGRGDRRRARALDLGHLLAHARPGARR